MRISSSVNNYGKNQSFTSVRLPDAEAVRDLSKLGDFYLIKDICARRKSQAVTHPLGAFLKPVQIKEIQQLAAYDNIVLTKSEYKEARFHKHDMWSYIQTLTKNAISVSKEQIKKVLPEIEKVKDKPFELMKMQTKALKKLGILEFKKELYYPFGFKKAS